MPTYDYACKDCEAVYDVKATVAEYDAGLNVHCPECGSDEAKRLLSGVSFTTGGITKRASAAAEAAAAAPSCGCAGGACGL